VQVISAQACNLLLTEVAVILVFSFSIPAFKYSKLLTAKCTCGGSSPLVGTLLDFLRISVFDELPASNSCYPGTTSENK
jgi:hypothetical protein